MEADVLTGMVFLPPTSDFPPDPEPLERDALNSTYLELRNCYSSLMRSRAQHRRLANKAKDETALLKERIMALASRDLPQRKELYELLEIVTAIAGDIDDAGDDLVNGFSRYKKGRHTFQGGGDFQERCRRLAPIQATCRDSNPSLAVVSSGGSLIQTTAGCCQQRIEPDQRFGWRCRACS